MGTTPRRLRGLADAAADGQRVFTLAELRSVGISRNERRSHIDAERWRRLPFRGIVIDHGPLAGPDQWRAVLLEVAGEARLGGITALRAAGLVGLEQDPIHVWVRKSTRKGVPSIPGVVVHESRRWTAEDAVAGPLPRARPAVAAMQAALWAVTLRQAALFLVMPVQQRLVRPEDLVDQLDRVRRHRFRSALRGVVADIGGGSHSMNELDVLALCRSRGLPDPQRQALRHGPDGRRYIDAQWPRFGVRLEVQGAGHGQLLQALDDDVRLIEHSTDGTCAISVSMLTLRVDAERFLDAFEGLLASRGWRRPAA